MSKKKSKSEVNPSVLKRFVACGGQGCCPTIERHSDGNIVLKDDFGGTVKVTVDQWDELRQADLSV